MPVQTTNARPGEDRPGAVVKTRPDHPITAAAAARIDAYVEHIVLVEQELAEARADLLTYREITQAALDVAHRLTAERDRLTERVRQLLEQLRALRAHDRRAA